MRHMVSEELDAASAGKSQTKRADASDDPAAQEPSRDITAPPRNWCCCCANRFVRRQSMLVQYKLHVALATWMDTAQRLSTVADELFSAVDKSALTDQRA